MACCLEDSAMKKRNQRKTNKRNHGDSDDMSTMQPWWCTMP